MAVEAGKSIKTLRNGRGWTQERLSKVSHVAVETIQRIETGKTKGPRQETLMALAAAFDTDVNRLLTGVTADEMESMVSAFTCAVCGARLVERTFIPVEYGECELDVFECGASIGWKDQPCPKDPLFPAFEEYDLLFEEEDGQWRCSANGRTTGARAVELWPGLGSSQADAERMIRRWYIGIRHGSEAAQEFLPI